MYFIILRQNLSKVIVFTQTHRHTRVLYSPIIFMLTCMASFHINTNTISTSLVKTSIKFFFELMKLETKKATSTGCLMGLLTRQTRDPSVDGNRRVLVL